MNSKKWEQIKNEKVLTIQSENIIICFNAIDFVRFFYLANKIL